MSRSGRISDHSRPRSPSTSIVESRLVVPETFERTQLQVAHILSAHSQLRSLKESDPDSLQDLLRAALVLVERSFVSATTDLAALAAPEAIRRGRMGILLMDLLRSDAETVVRLWMASRPPEELSDLVRRRLRAEPPGSGSDLERMFMGTVNLSVPWDRASELLASEQQRPGGESRHAGGLPDADARRGIRTAIDDLHARAINIVAGGDIIERTRYAQIDVEMVRRGSNACRTLLAALVESLDELLPSSSAEVRERTALDNRTRPSQLNRAVRAWAREQGLKVSTTGTLPRSLVDAYLASVERS